MFSIGVKIEGIENKKKVGKTLHLLAGFFLLINAAKLSSWTLVCCFFLTAITSIAYGFFRQRLDPHAQWNGYLRLLQIVAFLIIAILLTSTVKTLDLIALYVWSIVLAGVLLSERRVLQETNMHLREDGISIPGYFVKHQVGWDTIDDLVLRQDYVTIFRSDKKFVQLELLEDVAPAQIQQINSFSKVQISKAVKK